MKRHDEITRNDIPHDYWDKWCKGHTFDPNGIFVITDDDNDSIQINHFSDVHFPKKWFVVTSKYIPEDDKVKSKGKRTPIELEYTDDGIDWSHGGYFSTVMAAVDAAEQQPYRWRLLNLSVEKREILHVDKKTRTEHIKIQKNTGKTKKNK